MASTLAVMSLEAVNKYFELKVENIGFSDHDQIKNYSTQFFSRGSLQKNHEKQSAFLDALQKSRIFFD